MSIYQTITTFSGCHVSTLIWWPAQARTHTHIYPYTLLCLLVEMKPATLVWLSNDGGMFGRETSKRFAVQFFWGKVVNDWTGIKISYKTWQGHPKQGPGGLVLRVHEKVTKVLVNYSSRQMYEAASQVHRHTQWYFVSTQQWVSAARKPVCLFPSTVPYTSSDFKFQVIYTSIFDFFKKIQLQREWLDPYRRALSVVT